MSDLPVGVLPACITPFTVSGEIDLPGVARLMARFKTHGCAGVVLAGTNGEGPSLSAIEKRDLIRAAVPLSLEMPLVLGVATPSLDEAIWSCESARKAGAAAALVMPPAYFREVSERGLYEWFEHLISKTSLPVIAYNFPQRTGLKFSAEMIARLASLEGILGFKDSSGESENLQPYAQAANGTLLYVGAETLFPRALEAGWSGTISGAANVLSLWLVQIFNDWASERESAQTKFAYVLPALQALRSGGQPMANKAILHRLGTIENPAPRLPLLPLDELIVEDLWAKLRAIS